MKYYLNLDPDGYLLSVSKTDTGGPVVDSLEGIDLSGRRIGAFRWDRAAGRIVVDEGKLAELTSSVLPEESLKELEKLQRDLTKTDGDVLAGLEALLTVSSVTELVTAVVSAGASMADILAERKSLRDQIHALKETNNSED